jgi:predicted amidohydrolase YtcJ
MNRSLLLVSLILAAMGCTYQNIEADLIVHNAKIYTVDDAFSIVEAMAIKDGIILETGPEQQIRNKYRAKKMLNAGGKPVYPGFIDAHCHFLGLGLALQQVDLTETNSWKEVVDRVVEFSKMHPEGAIQGRGWDQNDWENKDFPTNDELNNRFPDRMVLLKRIDGHAAIANNFALGKAGIDANQMIDGGKIEVKNGIPTGILIDNAIELVEKIIPKPNQAQKKEALKRAEEVALSYGLVSVADAGLDVEDILLIDRLQEKAELYINMYVMISDNKENLEYFEKNGPIIQPSLQARSIKVYADGALGSRGACLLEPYADDPGNTGFLLGSETHFDSIAKYCLENGFQMNTHCIGDSANQLITKLYGKYLRGNNDLRWRIEHAQIVHEKDLENFKKFTIIPSVQPTHATSDMYWAEDRLGPDRMDRAYPNKSLLKANGILALGTDFPVEKVNPMLTFYAAVSGKDVEGYPEEGFQVDQLLSREEALRGMTIWAAIANFEENNRGSLEAGKVADFCVLDGDLMTVPEDALWKIKNTETYISGELVYPQ